MFLELVFVVRDQHTHTHTHIKYMSKGYASLGGLTGQDFLKPVFGLIWFFLFVCFLFCLLSVGKFCSRSKWNNFL